MSFYRDRKLLNRKIGQAGNYWLEKLPARLGNYAGVVAVPNKPGMVYARLETSGQVVEAVNYLAPGVFDMPVFVGRDKSQPSVLRVSDIRWVYALGSIINYIVYHAQQHIYPGPDTVWVMRDQFLPLLVLPAGGFNVRLFGDVIYNFEMSAPIRVEDADIDLSSYAVTAGAKYVLLEVLTDGTLNYIEGDLAASRAILEAGPLPVPSAGAFPICAFEFIEGQTELRRDSTERTIIDLRMFTSDVQDPSTAALDNTAFDNLMAGKSTIQELADTFDDHSHSGGGLINIGKVGIANELAVFRMGQKTRGVLESFHTLGRSPVSNPVIAVGGTTDSQIREIGNVLYEPDDPDRPYKTLYTGYQTAEFTDEYIHYAYSRDGITWTKYGKVISARRAEDPYVVKVNGIYYCFVEDTADASYSKVRRYHSSDFITWVDDGQITGISDTASPVVWWENGTWYLIYEHFPTAPNDIRLATSSDGLAWTNDGGNPIFDATDSVWLNDAAATVPDDILKLGTTYYLTYHGASGYYGVGIAKSTNLTSWTDVGQILSADTSETLQHLQFIYDDEGLSFLYWPDNYPDFDDDMGIYHGYAIDPTLTLSSDAITVLSDLYFLTSQSGTSDDLATINGGRFGQILVLRATSSHTITIKHSTGNISLNGAVDFALSGDKSLVLFCYGSGWSDIGAGGDLPDIAASGLTTRYEPVTNGDSTSPELLFAGGDVIMVEVTN